jgi:hypothetical protein
VGRTQGRSDMIDERIEDTVEEADEVIIDLSENEGDTPEEPINTEAPVTGIESVVEEDLEVEEEQSDEEITAQDSLASVKAETLVAQQYRARAQSQVNKPNEQSSPNPVTETPRRSNPYEPAPDRKAVEWQKRNRWFGGTDTSDRIMSQAALVIHKELVDDGIVPDQDSDEYYNELDARIRSEFPEKFKQKNVKKVPTVVGGSRATPGSSKIKLSKTEVEMATRLGVDLKEYARQKQRQLKAGG